MHLNKPSTFESIRFAPEIVLDATHAAEVIVKDIFEVGGEVEIGIGRDGRRWALVAFDEKLEASREPLTNADTWIVSGGGSGVTVASIIGVAQASTDANAHFVLPVAHNSLRKPRHGLIGMMNN